ncbi:MAG: RagB/SusD family nutrient uptake outer membrane protein [Bacteroidales bacterium]|nr:RagB/SusD family nutrient uptake outer membrane protein [Bacteroidales bacterium]
MKKIYSIILAVAALSLVISCEDALNKYPLDDITEESYFENATQLQLFTNSFYSSILPDVPYDEQSDLMIGNNPSNTLLNGSFRTVPASGGGWTWTVLRKINTCLGNLDRCPDEAARKEYSALCKFFRAWFYFDKVRRFGDVPWVDHELSSEEDDELYKPRDNRDVILGHMIEDIDEAIAGLPVSYASGRTFRATKWAALALKSRFCLFEGTYRKYHEGDITLWTLPATAKPATYYLELAADAAEELMDLGPHKLYSTGHPDYDYQNLFSNYEEDAGEFILAIDYDYSMKCFHDASGVALLPVCGRNSPTKNFVDHYLMADGTRYSSVTGWTTKTFADQVAKRDPRLHQTIRLPGYKYTVLTTNRAMFCDMDCSLTGYSIAKFVMPSDNLVMSNIRSNSYNDMPVIRLAEVYLNYAEAKAELGTLNQGDLDKSVNLLRKRAGMPDLDMAKANASPDPFLTSETTGYPKVTGANKGVILEIRRERVVELAMEGLRYADLLRWAEGERIPKTIQGMYFPGTGEYDWDKDGKPDICLYTGSKPSSNATFVYKIGTDIVLSDGSKGYVNPRPAYTFTFDPERDYLFPIPTNERVLNHRLLQNPGWNDGLDF